MQPITVGQPYQIVAVSDVYAPRCDAVESSAPTASQPRTSIIVKCCNNRLDAVIIASPDHWHVRMAVDALAAGKDVYLEKPVTHTLEEGAATYTGSALQQTDSAMWNAAAQLESLSRRCRSHSGRQPRPRPTGPNLLVAELSLFMAPKPVDTPARLEAMARRRSGAALQPKKVLPLALVLEFWRWRDDRSLHSLD